MAPACATIRAMSESGNWVDEARALVEAGQKIDAIKLVQRAAGCDIVRAKRYVDEDFAGLDGGKPPHPAMPTIERVDSDDWRGETVGAHLFFSEPLAEASLQKIAALWKTFAYADEHARLPFHPETHPYSCWRFHDDFAEVVFEPELEEEDDDMDPMEPLYAAEELAKQLHRLLPLRRVVVFAGSVKCPVEEASWNAAFEAALGS